MSIGIEERSWWRKLSIDALLERAASMSQADIEATLADMAGVAAAISVDVQDKTREPSSRSAARAALAKVTERRQALKALLNRVNAESSDEKRSRTEDMLEFAEAKIGVDNDEALRIVIAAMRAMWGMEG